MSATTAPVAATLTKRKLPASVRRRRFLLAVANHSLLIVAAIMFLAPFVFITLTALMTNGQALSSHLWPRPFRWQNFVDVFHQAPIWRWALNTMIYAVLATLGVLVSSIPVAYALSRIRWRGRNFAFATVLIALMLPPVVAVVPLYVMWAKLHLVGGLAPLIIPSWFGDAFSIFLLRQFFLTIPEEYLDAARVDGCGELRILATVVLRLAKPAIAAVALFSFLYTFNDFFLPLLYPRENPDQLGAADRPLGVPLAAPGAVEPDHGRDAARDGAGDHRLLPRAEGVRRGRHADGGQGMKIAVIGGGSTYTPELVSGLSRERDRIDVSELVLHDIDAERREVVGGLAQRMLDRQGYEGRLEVTDDLDRAVDGADFVLIQIRVGGQDGSAVGRDRAARVRLHRAGDDRRRRAREGAAHRSGRARDRRPRARARCRRRLDRRLHEPGGNRHPRRCSTPGTGPSASATSRSAFSGIRAAARGRAERRGDRSGRAEPPVLGPRVRVDGEDVLPELIAEHGDELAEDVGLPRRLLEELGVLPSYYLHYFYRTTRCSPSSSTASRARRRSRRSNASCWRCTAIPNLVEKPALLEQRGGAFYSEAAIGLVGVARGGRR